MSPEFNEDGHLRGYRPDVHTGWYERLKARHSEAMVARLLSFLPDRPKVLELGPGFGHFARALREATEVEYEGLEPSDFLRERLAAGGFAVSDEVAPPIRRPDACYDLVYASMFIENLPTVREAAGFAEEAKRVLKPGGLIVLIFPDCLTWGTFFFDEHYTHSFVTTERRVAHLLESQGFTVERTDQVLGWFWVKSGLLRNALRHLVTVAMWPLETRLVYWVLRYGGLGGLHFKLRKTFFQAVIMMARRSS